MYKLIDVSHWQGRMDWKKAAPLIDGAYIKASQGTAADPQIGNNIVGVQSNNIDYGLYHYYDTRVYWQSQLAFFSRMNDGQKFLPAIDLEMRSPAPKLADILSFILGLAEYLKPQKPVIYSGPAFILQYLTYCHELADYPLWLAHYSKNMRWPLGAPQVPLPWTPGGWTMWQYSADGNFEGKHYGAQSNHIDLDVAQWLPLWE